MLEGEIIMIRHIDNQRLQDKNALARELRQAADDITEGQFDLAKSRANLVNRFTGRSAAVGYCIFLLDRLIIFRSTNNR